MDQQFPTKPFYIHARNFPNHVLYPKRTTVEGSPRGTIVFLYLRPLTGALEELWYAEADSRGGYLLINLAGLDQVGAPPVRWCIGTNYSGTYEGIPAVTAVVAPFDPLDSSQVLKIEGGDEQAPFVVIQSVYSMISYFDPPWGYLNVYGGDPNRWMIFYHRSGDADSRWNLVTEDGTLQISGIEYDLANAVINTNLPPEYYTVATESNGTDSDYTYSAAFTWTSSMSWTLTNSTETSAGEVMEKKFGLSGDISEIIAVSLEGTATTSSTTTVTKADGTETVASASGTEQISMVIPPHRTFKYTLKVLKGEVSVPYTMRLIYTSTLPQMPPRTLTIKGRYLGMNVLNTGGDVTDVTSQSS
jgi:hypothetical protein